MKQLTRQQLSTMAPEEISAAFNAGELDDVVNGRVSANVDTNEATTPQPRVDLGQGRIGQSPAQTTQLSRDDLRYMTPAAIHQALEQGRLDSALRR